MKYFRVALVLAIVLGAVACGEKQADQEVSAQEGSAIQAIKDQKIVGTVRNTQFVLEQAIINNGNLKLRQGKDFFADVAVEIITFENEDISGKSFDSNGVSNPHIILGIKKEGEGLPNDLVLMGDYELSLKFGKKEELGIPFSIRLTAPKNGTKIEGSAFASFEDIQVLGGTNDVAIDVQFDSFDTLEYLAKKHINIDDANIGEKFGITYSSYGDDNPKSGFVGYEINTNTDEQTLAKIQLAKDLDGWKVVSQLEADQIHQAHSVLPQIEGNLRTVEGLKAAEVAGKKLEDYLNKQGFMPKVRATSVDCYLTKTAHKASCRAVFGLKVEDEIECKNKNYLLENNESSWQVESEILNTQKIDYSSGELVDNKPFAMSCK